MIRDDVADLRRYLVELRVLLADQASGEAGRSGKVIDSPAPWNDVIGELLTDIHAGARTLARTWAGLIGLQHPSLGAIDAGTMKALDFVGTCVERVRSRPNVEGRFFAPEIEATEAEVHAWVVRCRQELGILRDDERPWTAAPGGLRCPNPAPDVPEPGVCGARLWLAPGWALEPSPEVHCRRCGTSWTFELWHPLVA